MEPMESVEAYIARVENLASKIRDTKTELSDMLMSFQLVSMVVHCKLVTAIANSQFNFRSCKIR